MKATLDHIENTAHNIKTFWFKPERETRQIAGQFTEFKVPHDNKDSRGDRRWYTLSNSPSDDLLAITTKFAAENGSSFKKALSKLEPGSEVNMASPMGDFILPKDASIPLIFVAGGIGCTPFHSMIKYLQDSGETRDVTLLYGVVDKSELAFEPVFKQLGAQFKPFIGVRLTAEHILQAAEGKNDPFIYLSGPEPMVEALAKNLKEAGFNKKRIHTDFFPGYTEI